MGGEVGVDMSITSFHLFHKQLEFSKVFKNIFQDERVLEETRKALEACRANMARLQKQVCAGAYSYHFGISVLCI